MLEMLEPFLRPIFAVTAVLYLALAVRITRSASHSNSVIAFFLLLIGALVAGTAFSYGTQDPTIYGIGRVLSNGSSGFIAVAFYVVYRE